MINYLYSNMKIIAYVSSLCPTSKKMENVINSLSIQTEIYDIDRVDNVLIDAFHIKNTPTILLLNKNGEELWRFVGYVSKKDLEYKIKKLNHD